MKHSLKYSLIAALAATMMFALSVPAQAKTAQQERMKECSTQAKGKSGDERKTFMKSCLSAKAEAAPAAKMEAAPAAKMEAKEKTHTAMTGMSKSGKPLTAQQMKMKECSKQSKGMKGDARKKFMSGCLKKK